LDFAKVYLFLDKIMSAIPQYVFRAEDLIKAGRTTRSNIDDIRKWLKFKPNIPEMSAEQIVVFLIACDNIIENTQYTIESYFRYKSTCPELFQGRNWDNDGVQLAHKVTKYGVSPKFTKDNYLVTFAMLRDTYYYNYRIDDQVKVMFTISDMVLHSRLPDGIIFVLNMKGVGIMHLTRIKVGTVKKFLGYLQEAFPIQLRQVHVLNATYVFEKLLAIVKPFMKRELFDKIIAHPPNTPMEEFFEKYLPASCMPSDFGGELSSLDELSEHLQNETRKLKIFLETDDRQVQLYRKEK
ncbi:hypothetical protein NQ315_012355, partial [Exocentrus adspersus]